MVRLLKKIGKWTAIVIVSLLFLLLLVYGYSYLQYVKDKNKYFYVEPIDIKIPGDSASIAHGGHLLTVYGCNDCHSQHLEGRVMIDDRMLGYLKTSNLTKGKGGLPANFSDQDWLRALKHGINSSGNLLTVMPSNESSKIPDKDLADIIAYCKNVPPVDHDLGKQKIGPLAAILYAFGKIELFPGKKLDHSQSKPVPKPEMENSAEFGATLAINCTGCHRDNFGGGPPLAPGHPVVPNISKTGRPGKWTEAEFMQTLRTGVTPDGHHLDNEKMPWKRFGEFSDLELKALRTYILTFPKQGTELSQNQN